MLKFAWQSLWRDRLRFGITVGGVALAVLLILVMNGLFSGSARQITAYIDENAADLFVAQAGVRNMHMATSVLPLSLAEQLRGVAGVAAAEPIRYFPAILEWDGQKDFVYAIGLAGGATLGGPWRMEAGQALPGPGEVVISARQRAGRTPQIGDQVRVSGLELTIVGLSLETKSLASTLVFIHEDEAAALRGAGRANFFLVQTADGQSSASVAEGIRERVAGVAVLARDNLSANDRRIAMEMGVEILAIMALVGFAVGLAVVTLTIYVATVEQLRQYAVLKALGAGPGHLFSAILGQGLAAAVVGYAVGIGLAFLAAALVPRLIPGLAIDLIPADLVQVSGLVVLMGTLAAVAPFLRVQRVDPVDVFRP